MNKSTLRPPSVLVFCALACLYAIGNLFVQIRILIHGALNNYPLLKGFAVLEIVTFGLLLLAAISLFRMKKASFLLSALSLLLLLIGQFRLGGLSAIAMIFVNPIFFGLNVIPIAMAIYTGILFKRGVLS